MKKTQLFSTVVAVLLVASSLIAQVPNPLPLFWGVSGNTGLIDGVHFLGTADNVPLTFRVNNITAGRIDHLKLNSYFGFYAGLNNTSGKYNTGIGAYSLQYTTTGMQNTAVGHETMVVNTTGNGNSALGESALYNNSTGSANTGIGFTALRNNTTGNYNSGFGSEALINNLTGLANTALGRQALSRNETGSNNTAVGSYALDGNVSGDYNTALGYNAFDTGSTYSNSMALGANTVAITASNVVHIGDASITAIKGQVGFSTYSDGRLKKNVRENVPGLAFINLLRPVTYNYDINKELELTGTKSLSSHKEKYNLEKIPFTGFIAQEVDAAAKKIDYNFSGVDKSENVLAIRYSEFTVPLVKAVQELSKQNEVLQKQIEKLEEQVAILSKSMGEKGTSSIDVNLGNVERIVLNQNEPNPFSEQTSISYILPTEVKQAQILFYDATGKMIKTVELTERGNGSIQVYAANLSRGIYSYSIVADGKVVDGKKMMKKD